MEKVTSVKIDNDKWEILKGRGYRLQDILDNAFNNLLDIENKDDKEIMKDIKKLEDKNKSYKLEKENLKKILKNETKKLESKIKELEENYKNKVDVLENKIEENNYKIKESKKAIKEYNIKKEEENENNKMIKDYTDLINKLMVYKGNFTPEFKLEIQNFGDKWNIKKEADINNMLYDEYVNRLFRRQRNFVHDIKKFREDVTL